MSESKPKPNWWPDNPYPQKIFTMSESRFEEALPDPAVRTGVAGMLGREFWDIASKSIWDALQNAKDEIPIECKVAYAWITELEGQLAEAKKDAKELVEALEKVRQGYQVVADNHPTFVSRLVKTIAVIEAAIAKHGSDDADKKGN